MLQSPDIRTFQRRLAETIAWCNTRGDLRTPRGSLRTPVLRPAALDPNRPYCRYQWDTRAERATVVDALAEKRARLLRCADACPERWTEAMAGGRLLAYDPDANLFDGVAEEWSEGFFDVDNVPPWDTWVCYISEREEQRWRQFDSYLISWVPPSFLKLAEAGMWINPEQCILWADELEAPFMDQLRAEGLLAAR